VRRRRGGGVLREDEGFGGARQDEAVVGGDEGLDAGGEGAVPDGGGPGAREEGLLLAVEGGEGADEVVGVRDEVEDGGAGGGAVEVGERVLPVAPRAAERELALLDGAAVLAGGRGDGGAEGALGVAAEEEDAARDVAAMLPKRWSSKRREAVGGEVGEAGRKRAGLRSERSRTGSRRCCPQEHPRHRLRELAFVGEAEGGLLEVMAGPRGW
jgi:hypothetical protein